ncbi:MAG: polyprenyl synthetase family protein, partial [Clostridia bacterium]
SEANTLQQFGRILGEIFQIVDDILDVTSTSATLGKSTNKDILQDKKTFVRLNGIENSKKFVQQLQQQAIDCLKIFGDNAKSLIEFCMHLTNRLN